MDESVIEESTRVETLRSAEDVSSRDGWTSKAHDPEPEPNEDLRNAYPMVDITHGIIEAEEATQSARSLDS